MSSFAIHFSEVKTHFENIVYLYIEIYKGLCIIVFVKYRPKLIFKIYLKPKESALFIDHLFSMCTESILCAKYAQERGVSVNSLLERQLGISYYKCV